MLVSVESDTAKIGMSFTTKTKKWDAEIKTEETWEKQMSDLTSVFIPASGYFAENQFWKSNIA